MDCQKEMSTKVLEVLLLNSSQEGLCIHSYTYVVLFLLLYFFVKKPHLNKCIFTVINFSSFSCVVCDHYSFSNLLIK